MWLEVTCFSASSVCRFSLSQSVHVSLKFTVCWYISRVNLFLSTFAHSIFNTSKWASELSYVVYVCGDVWPEVTLFLSLSIHSISNIRKWVLLLIFCVLYVRISYIITSLCLYSLHCHCQEVIFGEVLCYVYGAWFFSSSAHHTIAHFRR